MADKGLESEENREPLSATAMFLRSFAAAPERVEPSAVLDTMAGEPAVEKQAQATELTHPDFAAPLSPVEQPRSEPGEFTRMFRPMLDTQPLSPVQSPRTEANLPVKTPVSPPPAPPPSAAPAGEFTRAFVLPSADSLPPAAPPPLPASTQPAQPKVKGFSSPGISDSASAEGSFTRMFRPQVAPADAPIVAQQQPYAPEAAPASPSPYGSPSRPVEPMFPPVSSALPPPMHAGSGVTELFRALAPDGESYPRAERAYPLNPLPTHTPFAEPTRLPSAPPPAPLAPGGGVTALLSRLTEDSPAVYSAPATETLRAVPPPPAYEVPPAPVDTRGEFTRIIDAAQIQQALSGASPATGAPAPAPPAPAAPLVTFTPPAVPAAPKLPPTPSMSMQVTGGPAPAAHASAMVPSVLPSVPKVALPKVTIAPTGKTRMQEIVPFLLIANAFLMLILILLVIFLLHRR